MEAIKIKAVAHDGVLSVKVPKEFDDQELEVIIRATTENENEGYSKDEVRKQEEKVKRLMSIVGAAKFPDFPITKYDVYEQ